MFGLCISLVIILFWWPNLSLSKEFDSPCPAESPCIQSSECHWFNEFLALRPGTLEYRDRIPKMRQAVCNQEDEKICCPGARVRCPEGQHCVSAVNCSSHQNNIKELRQLGRGTREYKKRREHIKANTIICSKESYPKQVCCSKLLIQSSVVPKSDFPCTCGCRPEKVLDLFITDGETTSPGTWPWVAVLLYSKQSTTRLSSVFCGGTLISLRHVLTAAHCLSNPELGSIDRVVLGENDRRTDYDCREVFEDCGNHCPCRKYRNGSRRGGRKCFEDNLCADKAKVVPVLRATPHPKFRKKGSVPYDDIAILTLKFSVSLSPWIVPICLSIREDIPPGSPVWLAGWGNTQPLSLSSSATSASILQSLQQHVVSQSSCSEKWFGLELQDNQVCATTGQPGKAGCRGDSGGPLVRPRREEDKDKRMNDDLDDRWELVGVISAGPQNCGSPIPAIYTKINSDMRQWIRRVVGEQLLPRE